MTRAALARPTRVLFIAGPARSGSTLLAMLLGATEGMVDTGELNFAWRTVFLRDEYCGCARRFRDCPFWSAVVDRGFGGVDGIDARRQANIQHQLIHGRSIPLLYTPRLMTPALRRSHRQFAEGARQLVEAVAAVAGADVVVDSSKFSGYGAALRAVPGLHVRAVHLVRDSRAVAFSWSRRKEFPTPYERKPLMQRMGPAEAAARWTGGNLLTELVWDVRGPVMRLRYEDLVRDPAAAVRRVRRFAGLEGDGGLPFAAGSFEPGEQHTVTGNPMRMQQGPIAIREDLEWREALPPRARRTVTAITAPLMLRYGYSLR